MNKEAQSIGSQFIEKSDWAFIQELRTVYERASLSDILSILPFLILFLFLGSIPVIWALRKGYNEVVERFEAENPHLKGQYFSFWKWFYLKDDTNLISSKHYKKQFGETSFVNTDNFAYLLKESKEKTKGFGKDFSLPTKIAIILLVVIMASALV